MATRTYIFAGGGTGGHIYPGIAVAQRIRDLEPEAAIKFLASTRDIDSHILTSSGFDFEALEAIGLSKNPLKVAAFAAKLIKSRKRAKTILRKAGDAVVIGTGGFVTAPVVWATKSLNIPVYLINVDIVPGKANKLLKSKAEKIFVQFDQTSSCFPAGKVTVTGCPLRKDFFQPDTSSVYKQLGLDPDKKLLLITGASSGAANINNAIETLIPKLDQFSGTWQIVHLTGRGKDSRLKQTFANSRIKAIALDYWQDMASLLSVADIVIGRSGAISVAEYAASATPSICMPYPYHKDRHQYLNAGVLVDAGAAVIAEDIPANPAATADNLWTHLQNIMTNDPLRTQMTTAAQIIGSTDAATLIARHICRS